MKLNFKKIIYMILITILLVSCSKNKVLAADTNPILSVETTKDKLVPGEEITAEVKFNNNNVLECCGFDFKLKYDTNSLEVVSSEVVIKTGASAINEKADDSVNFVLLSISPLEYNDTLIKVTFKVKDNAKGGETILDILPNNSESPISNEEKDIPTTIYSKKLTIDSQIKEDTNDSKSNNKTSTEEKETHTNNEDEESGIQIKYNSNITNENTEENESETEELVETKTNQKEKEAVGLPNVVIAVLIIISVVGILVILVMLRKKKK